MIVYDTHPFRHSYNIGKIGWLLHDPPNTMITAVQTSIVTNALGVSKTFRHISANIDDDLRAVHATH